DHLAVQGDLPLADRGRGRLDHRRRVRGCRGAGRLEVLHRRVAAPGAVIPTPTDRSGTVEIIEGDNLEVAASLASGSFPLVYLDPPFNTGRVQERQVVT